MLSCATGSLVDESCKKSHFSAGALALLALLLLWVYTLEKGGRKSSQVSTSERKVVAKPSRKSTEVSESVVYLRLRLVKVSL